MKSKGTSAGLDSRVRVGDPGLFLVRTFSPNKAVAAKRLHDTVQSLTYEKGALCSRALMSRRQLSAPTLFGTFDA